MLEFIEKGQQGDGESKQRTKQSESNKKAKNDRRLSIRSIHQRVQSSSYALSLSLFSLLLNVRPLFTLSQIGRAHV